MDINCDIGEGCGNDAELMRYISSANIACGFHAGDEATMRRTVELALENGVAVGAHPGYRDRENFGRTEMDLSRDEVKSLIFEQLEALKAECDRQGAKIRHVKPHGALYNRAAKNGDLAKVLAEAVSEFDKDLIFYGLSGSLMIGEAEKVGLKSASEVFADRSYQSDGTLTPRSQPNSLIFEIETSVTQVLDMVKYGRVRSNDAIMVPIKAETICVHGDGPQAVELVTNLRRALTSAGIDVAPPLAGLHEYQEATKCE